MRGRFGVRQTMIAVAAMLVAIQVAHVSAQTKHQNLVIDLWAQGKPAFGVYAPNENPGPRGPGAPPQKPLYTKAGGETLAMNPLYDYVFLNLEGSYDQRP